MSKQPTDLRQPPPNVIVICSVMVAGSVVALVLGAVQLTVSAGIRQGVLMDSAESPPAPSDIMRALLFFVAAFLWLWMAWKNRQGRAWARNLTILAGILVVVGSATAFLTLSGRLSVLASVSYGVSAVLSVIILALIWRKESNNFYETQRHPKPDRDDEPPAHYGPVALGTFSADGSH